MAHNTSRYATLVELVTLAVEQREQRRVGAITATGFGNSTQTEVARGITAAPSCHLCCSSQERLVVVLQQLLHHGVQLLLHGRHLCQWEPLPVTVLLVEHRHECCPRHGANLGKKHREVLVVILAAPAREPCVSSALELRDYNVHGVHTQAVSPLTMPI